MRLLVQFQTSLIFLYEKISRVIKRKSNQNQPIFSLLEVFMREKLLPLLFYVCLILFVWLVLVWFAFLYLQNLLKKKLVWNCPNHLIHHTTFLIPINRDKMKIKMIILILIIIVLIIIITTWYWNIGLASGGL